MRISRTLFGVALLALALGSSAAEPLTAVSVLDAVAQKKSARDRGAYLKANANALVEGAGTLESITPRKFFDTSVPDSNAVVALIQIEGSRKIVCGLPKEVFDALGWLQPGAPVGFRGRLSDAQEWENSVTLYLGNCALTRRR